MTLESHLRCIVAALRLQGMRARRGLSQHFLLHASTLRRICSVVPLKDRTVVEIGTGPGSLTAALLEAGARVIGVEIDRQWLEFMESSFSGYPGLRLLGFDVMGNEGKDLEAVLKGCREEDGRRPLVISNLPYRVASPLIVRLVRSPAAPERCIVMIQREVAERMCAAAGGRTRGLLTLLVGVRAKVRSVFRVSRAQFRPAPRVDSSVIDIVRVEEWSARADRLTWLDPLLKRAFSGRRKMLRKSLAALLRPGDLEAFHPEIATLRAEALSTEQWLALAEHFEQRRGRCPCP